MSFDPNTHGVYIQWPDGSVSFIDGIKDKCEHQWDGPGYHIVSKIGGGMPDKFIANNNHSQEMIEAMDASLRKQGMYISGGGASCSKCGKPFEPPIFDI